MAVLGDFILGMLTSFDMCELLGEKWLRFYECAARAGSGYYFFNVTKVFYCEF
jgi:hypothetical protein